MPNDLLPLTIAGVLDFYVSNEYDFRNKECEAAFAIVQKGFGRFDGDH